ncbi:restriction endonuclease fold toxin 5 domain-containing protein [Burkholderia glumae]
MAGLAVPAIEAAVEVLGHVLARAGAALLGGAAVAGTASLSGDASKDASKATPAARAVPRTGESCKKCPPEAGFARRANHSMTARSRQYQGRVTGRPYSVAEGWSEEWEWVVEFDGFLPAQCLLQEAKAGYDQFLDEAGQPLKWFQGFRTMTDQINAQARLVRGNPPAQLMWYFETPRARAYMLPVLNRYGVASVFQP